ncbi:MAG: translation elongation factor EF-1 subunit alpha [Nanoarchaeota archaeon]|nr:translation elongation factor EF-1 subunit alpha [Nanoarchaeota archaeon]MBU1445231.1 translation elongation factor EF-1 subunit alpha [Nanoarchaeota archaeon]MBU2406752.1 translation elongation factor EF-1 subunit alpha [Nanoarchaeota archaeon]MBU2420397.1 translation elongation factor EF-1 subunit alpha [Nanoarchaeota archaeon]MBU2475175.1 translation elongation factor EF-1 subunit alpha [Nanoarchaeota archaeon]
MAKEKPHINIVFVGHVDHGKSTSVGRLAYDSGNVSEQQMRKLKEKAQELGKSGFEFAFVMDNLKEERERGVTIDLAHRKFVSQKFEYTIIDAPGHKDFIKNMITGASQADVGVLVVAASDSVMAQTKEHVFLCKTLGVGQMAVLVNKMDAVNFDEAKYNKVKEDVSALLKQVGYKLDEVSFIAASALQGDNIAKRSDKMAWYKGPTLLEQLDLFKEPEKPTGLPLRLPIQDVYNIAGIGVVPVGRVETGTMKVGQKIIVVPARDGKGAIGEVKSIEMHHEQITEAIPGDNIGFNVRGIGKKDIARGDVLGSIENPPTLVSEFTAQLVVLNHPTVMTVGYTPVFHVHTSQVACQITEIVKKMNPATGEEITENKDILRNGDAAIVKIKPSKPLVIEKQSEIPHMSRFAIRDAGCTVAAGMCIDLVKKAA